ncbi:MAG: hypothetical protein AAFY60_19620, partial [Myxococcota bacterium]
QHAWDSGIRGATLSRIEGQWYSALSQLKSTFSAVQVVSARSLNSDATHRYWRHRLSHLADYERSQVADLLTLSSQKGRLVKVGWTLDDPRPRGDEVYFDRCVRPYRSGHLGFVYTGPGHAFRSRCPRLAPYVALEHRTRLMLADGDAIQAKLNRARASMNPSQFRAALHHYRGIAYGYQKLFGTLNGALPERLARMSLASTPSLQEGKRHVV